MNKNLIYLIILSLNILYADSNLLALEQEENLFIQKLSTIKKEHKQDSNTTKYQITHFDANKYISLKDIPTSTKTQDTNLSYTPKEYLSLKQIIYPMPDDYAYMYLKMKTLINPATKFIRVYINKRRQRMSVYLDNKKIYECKVSTARRGYWTPRGTFRPYNLERMHYSRKYHNSPMPYSVFFKGGYAIHGTYSISRLGRPASHGCVRVHPKNAKRLYSLIRRYGKRNTKIVIY